MPRVRGGGGRDQLITLRDDLRRLMPVITVITRVRYRPRATVLRHRHGAAEIVLQCPLLHVMMPRRRVRLLRRRRPSRGHLCSRRPWVSRGGCLRDSAAVA